MIELRKLNYEDIEEEYEAIKEFPESENGFENSYHGISREEFENEVFPLLVAHSEGKRLKEGRVPDTYFFLWDDDKIVGLFKIRHYLNEALSRGAGHVAYGILPKYRGKGYATIGLQLTIEKCKEIIAEDEIYMSVRKDNVPSLKVQLKNGAYIVGETSDHYLTRIKIEKRKNSNIKK